MGLAFQLVESARVGSASLCLCFSPNLTLVWPPLFIALRVVVSVVMGLEFQSVLSPRPGSTCLLSWRVDSLSPPSSLRDCCCGWRRHPIHAPPHRWARSTRRLIK